jgi:uncharacterized membrane protein
MTWALLALASGVFNALWTSQIKSKVQMQGAFIFTASLRWGVVLLILPLVAWQWQSVSARWWFFTVLSGVCESLSMWTLARGSRRDYYSSYALSNITPLFTLFMAAYFLGEELTVPLVVGVFLVAGGVLWMYYRGHWSWWGLWAAGIGAFSALFSKMVISEAGPVFHAGVSFAAGAAFCTAISLRRKPLPALGKITALVWDYRYLAAGSALATFCFYSALYLAPLSRMSPLVRINLVVGFLLSVYHLGEKRDWKGRAFGALLLLLGLLLVLWK